MRKRYKIVYKSHKAVNLCHKMSQISVEMQQKCKFR